MNLNPIANIKSIVLVNRSGHLFSIWPVQKVIFVSINHMPYKLNITNYITWVLTSNKCRVTPASNEISAISLVALFNN